MQAWFSAESLLGLGVASLFALLAARRLPAAILVYTVLGLVPTWQIGGFAGRQIVQGLLFAQVLGSVLIAAWLIASTRARSPVMVPTPFNRWLIAVPAIGVVSLVFSLAWRDPTINPGNINVAVSVGQILLYLWPIGIYMAVAASVPDTAFVRRFVNLVLLLAVPQVVLVVAPYLDPYLFWSRYVGLVATPLATARVVSAPRAIEKLAYAGLAVLPLVQGLGMGKAFLYAYVIVAIGTVLWLAARRLLVVAVPVVALAAAVSVLVDAGPPAGVQRMIELEREQQSWGGRAGRVALAQDAVRIWSDWPVLGVGPGNSYAYMLRYSVIGTPHNQYLDMLVEIGLLGVVAFLAFLVSAWRFGLRAWRRARDPVLRELLLGWLGGFAALAAGGLTGDYLLHSIRNGGLEMFSGYFIHWVFLGVAMACVRLEHEPAPALDVAPARGPTVWLRTDEAPRIWSTGT